MTEPREFRIVESMQAALRAVTVAGGYHHDFANLAVKLDADHKVEDIIGEDGLRPFVVLDLAPDLFEHFPSSQVRLTLPFVVHAIDNANLEDDADKLKTYFRLCADVEQALAVDTSRKDVTTGEELATDTRVLQRSMSEWQGREVWAQVAGEVRLNRTHGAPNG